MTTPHAASTSDVAASTGGRLCKEEAVDVADKPVTTTPPSSPPLLEEMRSSRRATGASGSMGPPKTIASRSRKRSADGGMRDEAPSAGVTQSVGSDIAPLASQGKDDTSIDSQAVKISASQQAQNQQTATQASKDALTKGAAQTQQLPPSGQGSKSTASQSANGKMTRKEDATERTATNNDETESVTSDLLEQSEPQDRIEDFDWNDLVQRYHDKMKEFEAKEHANYGEFAQLAEFFNIWANVGSSKEADRSFKRMKTQLAYVQHEEGKLEHKRLHYVKVVEAFKSALELLG